MNVIEHEVGELIDECDVCGLPIENLDEVITQDYGGKLLSFCSQSCFDLYLEDPARYAEFEDDQEVE
ncbi:YHS domain-containing protein [Candidatus Uhrbacteria bacterium]|nr:YHS domain-containing protein [Candidatus Uhrbacteria bacterium]